MTMKTRRTETAVESRAKATPVTVVRIISRTVRSVSIFHVNPGLGRLAAHFSVGFLLRRSPRQPDRVYRHPGADLTLTNQGLIGGRERIEHVLMFGNSVFQ